MPLCPDGAPSPSDGGRCACADAAHVNTAPAVASAMPTFPRIIPSPPAGYLLSPEAKLFVSHAEVNEFSFLDDRTRTGVASRHDLLHRAARSAGLRHRARGAGGARCC